MIPRTFLDKIQQGPTARNRIAQGNALGILVF